MVEICAVVDGCNLRGCSSEDLGPPGVEMGVEMDDRDGSIRLVHGSQQRQSNSMITSHGNDTRQCLSVLGGSNHVCVGSGLAHQDTVMAFFNLLQSPLIVIAGHRDITAIDDGGPSAERVGLEYSQYFVT